jgi:hypothetical protein
VTATSFEIGYSTWNRRLLGVLGLGPKHSLVKLTFEPPVPARTWFIALKLRVLRVSVVDRDGLLAALA